MPQPKNQWPQSNTEWVESLCGQRGVEAQERSHLALGHYLYVVGFNHLRQWQNSIALLASFADEELATLAEEFVQEFLIRLTVNDYARLKGYQGKGAFQIWAAVGLRRLIEKDLEKKSWHERTRLPEQAEDHRLGQPSAAIEQLPAHLSLEHCLAQLPERERIVFLRRVVNEEDAQTIAADLGTTTNAVHILLSRAKSKLRLCLEEQGIRGSTDV